MHHRSGFLFANTWFYAKNKEKVLRKSCSWAKVKIAYRMKFHFFKRKLHSFLTAVNLHQKTYHWLCFFLDGSNATNVAKRNQDIQERMRLLKQREEAELEQ